MEKILVVIIVLMLFGGIVAGLGSLSDSLTCKQETGYYDCNLKGKVTGVNVNLQ